MRSSIHIALICVILAQVASAGSIGSTPSTHPCGYVLEAAEATIKAQDESIERLKTYSRQLEARVDKDEATPLIPTWIWIFTGVVVGGVVGYSLHR
jgi:hypothetical protein